MRKNIFNALLSHHLKFLWNPLLVTIKPTLKIADKTHLRLKAIC